MSTSCLLSAFRLDPDLYKACRADAKKICNAPKWEDTNSELPGGMVVACLYRNSLDEKVSFGYSLGDVIVC